MAPYVVPRLGIHPSLVDISKTSMKNLLKYDFLYYFGSIFCIFSKKNSPSKRRFDFEIYFSKKYEKCYQINTKNHISLGLPSRA